MAELLKDMAFGFEYEILYECGQKHVSFTKLKTTFDKLQDVPKDEKWIVKKDASLEQVRWQETWKQSNDSDFFGSTVNKHIRCSFSHEDSQPEDKYSGYDGTAEIVSPVIEGYDAIAPAFAQFDALVKSVEKSLKITFFNNSTTSNHVHLSHPLMFSIPGAVKVFMAWLYFEPLFAAMVGHRRRENRYCLRTQHNWKTAPMKKLFASLGNGIGRNPLQMPVAKYIVLLDNLNKLFTLMPKLNRYMRYIEPWFTTMKKGLKAKGMDYLRTDPGEVDEYNILDYFVDAVGNQERLVDCRYVALNMTNLSNDDQNVATIEVRLKHGSNNMDANAKWVQLLAAFFAAALDNPCVTAMFDDVVKTRFYDILMRNVANDGLYASDAAFLKARLNAFMTAVQTNGVKEATAYWLKKVETVSDHVNVDDVKPGKKRVTKASYEAAKAKGQHATKEDFAKIKAYEEAEQMRGNRMYGGMTRTTQKVAVAGRTRVVYLDERGKKYVRMRGELL